MTEEIHKHYHVWPNDPHGNCSCGVGLIILVVCATILVLAYMDKLPW